MKNIGFILLIISIILLVLYFLLAKFFKVYSSYKEYRLIKKKGYVDIHKEKEVKDSIYRGEVKKTPKRKRAISPESRAILNEMNIELKRE